MTEAILNAETTSASSPDAKSVPTATATGREWRRTAAGWLFVAMAYWLALFAGTHTSVEGPIPAALWKWDADKLVHAGAYFGLATVLLIAWRRTGAYPGIRGRLIVAAIALAYGVIDEITQPLVGRQCELLDWLADAAGVALAVGVDTWRHPRSADPALARIDRGASL